MMPAVKARRKYAVTLWFTAIAVAAWAATGITDLLNTPDHIWHICLNIGTVASNAALLSVVISQLIHVVRELHEVNDRMERYYTTLADAFRERPDPAATPRPWPALRLAGADDSRALRSGRGGSPRSSGA